MFFYKNKEMSLLESKEEKFRIAWSIRMDVGADDFCPTWQMSGLHLQILMEHMPAAGDDVDDWK